MRPLLRLVVSLALLTAAVVGAVRALGTPWGDVSSNLWEAKAQKVGDLTELSERSIVYDRDGNVLTIFKAEENRKPVKLADVSPVLVNAILDVEDSAFYEHGGFDVRSTARAFLSNSSAGGIRQGGSTITQQLVKNSLLTPERSIDRKIKEAVLATRLEKQMTKQEILERYLNLVYMGNGAYGVEAAAETYFGVTAKELTNPAQAAMLAGLIRNPLANDPLRNPEQAVDRRNTALQQMADNDHLAQEEADKLKSEPLPTKLVRSLPQKESYFIEEMKQRLLDDPRLGDTPTERYNAVFRGGLRIRTTFDARAQALAEKAVKEGVPSGRLNRIGAVAALVTVEPGNGAVRAVVGGPGFENFKYDIATHRPGRQPGSTFKAFTLLAALEAGYGPNSGVDGSGPCVVAGNKRKPELIQNAGDSAGGGGTLASATAGSVNCAYERMAATIGFDKVLEMAKRLGLKGNYPPYASIIIGAGEATPLEMASAYATIANDGVRHEPTFIDVVQDRNGHELFKGTDEGKRVLEPRVARLAASVMKGVFHGTATCCALAGGRQAAGKTGTTNDSTNAWFVGYTPQAATAVWLGVPDENKPMNGLGGRGSIYGATFSAPIWERFMNEYLADMPKMDFQAPPKGEKYKARFVLPKGAAILPGSGGTGTATTKKKTTATTSTGSSTPTTKGGGTATTRPPVRGGTTVPPTTKAG